MNVTINDEIDQDLDIDTEEAGDPDPKKTGGESAAGDEDLDFDFDENGDIIIPDEDEDGDSDEDTEDDDEEDDEEFEGDEDGADADEDEEEEDEASEEGAEDSSDQKDEAPSSNEPDEKDKQILALDRQLAALRSQTKDTLAKLGVDIKDDDVMAGLVKLAAEADDTTPEEYLRKKNERERNEEAVRTVQKMAFEKKMREDLAEIHAAYPETRNLDSVTKFPNFREFGKLRDLGLSPKQAYIASHSDAVMASVASSTKRQSLNETKNHLKPAVSKSSKDHSLTLTRRELAEYRELFPDLNDREIAALYRQAKK